MPNLIKQFLEKSLSNPSWDLILFWSVLAIAFFYGFARGKRKLTLVIIYTYVALGVFSVMPLEKIARLGLAPNEFLLKIGVFLAIFLLINLLLGRKNPQRSGGRTSWSQLLILTFLEAGFLTSVILNFLPPADAAKLSHFSKTFIAGPAPHFWWTTAPLVFVIILRRVNTGD